MSRCYGLPRPLGWRWDEGSVAHVCKFKMAKGQNSHGARPVPSARPLEPRPWVQVLGQAQALAQTMGATLSLGLCAPGGMRSSCNRGGVMRPGVDNFGMQSSGRWSEQNHRNAEVKLKLADFRGPLQGRTTSSTGRGPWPGRASLDAVCGPPRRACRQPRT